MEINSQRYDLFTYASQLLAHYQARQTTFRSREVELAFVLHRQYHLIPEVGSEQTIALTQIIDWCDDLYTKVHPRLTAGWIWPPLSHDRQGLPQPTIAHDPRWYKGANGQQGLGCHAQAAHFWHSPAFLAEDRDLCPFRVYDGVTALTLDQGRQSCGFDNNPCGWQPGLPKFLQVIGRHAQAQVARAPSSSLLWRTLISEPIPVYPLLVALYFGHLDLHPPAGLVTPEQFCQDFNFEPELFAQIFTAEPTQAENQEFLRLAHLPEQVVTLNFAPRLAVAGRPRPTGGHLILEPEELPTYQKSGLPSGLSHDPLLAERRRRRQLERTTAHNHLVRDFRRWFRWAGKEVREDPDTFDFLAIDDQQILLAEIKLLGQQDIAEAIQETIGQLFYYEHFALAPWRQAGYPIAKAAVFDHPPLGDYLLYFQSLDVQCYWLDEQGRIDGPTHSLVLLEQMGVRVCQDPELVS